jgi:hypothetical protein
MYKTHRFDLSERPTFSICQTESGESSTVYIDLRLGYVMKCRLHAGYHIGQFEDLVSFPS